MHESNELDHSTAEKTDRFLFYVFAHQYSFLCTQLRSDQVFIVSQRDHPGQKERRHYKENAAKLYFYF